MRNDFRSIDLGRLDRKRIYHRRESREPPSPVQMTAAHLIRSASRSTIALHSRGVHHAPRTAQRAWRHAVAILAGGLQFLLPAEWLPEIQVRAPLRQPTSLA